MAQSRTKADAVVSKLEIELVDFDGTPELLDIQAFYAK
jgi:hypothetical protein